MGCLSNFIVYFMAMIGIIVLALYVYKKFSVSAFTIKKNNSLHIEDTLSLSPRKTLYVIKNGNERFLIAADLERTTLISKLADGEVMSEDINPRMVRNVDLSQRAINSYDNVEPIKKPIMKEIKNRLNF